MLVDRETRHAVAATGAYERITRSGRETEQMSIAEDGVVGPTVWLTYSRGEVVYRGANPVHAIRVAKLHDDDVETTVDEVPLYLFEENTPESMPMMGMQALDDGFRGAEAPDVLDVLLGYGDLTDSCGAPLGETMDWWTDDLFEWERADATSWAEEFAFAWMDEVGCFA